MNQNPLISVIVPIYKVEAYLDRCLESIVNQTYENLEIILVDDGSPDNCPQMCDDWAKKDNRIKVIHNENSGVSYARNAGFELSKGEFIAFVDSDDWICETYIQDLYIVMRDECCDVVECDYSLVNDENCKIDKISSVSMEIFTAEEALHCNLIGDKFGDVIWNRLYHRSVVDVKFENGKFHEDVYWVYQVLAKAKKLAHINQTLYFYFQRNDGFTGEKYTFKRIDAVLAGELRSRYISDKYPRLASIAQFQFIGMCMYHSQKLLESKIEEYEKFFKILHAKAKNIGNEWKKQNNIFAKQKMWLSLYLKFPKLICKIRNMLKIGM